MKTIIKTTKDETQRIVVEIDDKHEQGFAVINLLVRGKTGRWQLSESVSIPNELVGDVGAALNESKGLNDDDVCAACNKTRAWHKEHRPRHIFKLKI